jgi:hypothetical protein
VGQARAIAAEFDRVNADVCRLVSECTAADWTASCAEEGWPVGAVVAHIAEGYGGILGWVQEYLAGRPVQITRAEIDAANLTRSASGAALSRAEALELLHTRAALAIAVISDIDDEKLAATHPFGPAGGHEVSLGQVCAILTRHTSRHLISCRAALSGG